MVSDGNDAEARAWNAGRGRSWVNWQALLDAQHAPISRLILEAVDPAPGSRVLDIGCGAGATTLEIAPLVAPAMVLGVDISEPLIRHAEARAAAIGAPNATFRIADAQDCDFEPAAFDLMVSRLGAMFFANPVEAFRNIARALKPGARMVLACWAGPESNPWFTLAARAAAERLGRSGAPDPTAPGPLAFGDIERVVAILAAAGLADCRGEEVMVELTPDGSLDEVSALATEIGPAGRLLAARSGTEEDRAAIAAMIHDAYRPFVTADGIRLPAGVNLFQALVA